MKKLASEFQKLSSPDQNELTTTIELYNKAYEEEYLCYTRPIIIDQVENKTFEICGPPPFKKPLPKVNNTDIMPFNDIAGIFHVTINFKVSLFKKYLEWIKEKGIGEKNQVRNRNYYDKYRDPTAINKMASCYLEGLCEGLTTDDNDEIAKIWVEKREAIILMFEKIYKNGALEPEAEGLFFLFLTYAFDVFTVELTPEDAQKACEGSRYGMKNNLYIMNRNSFSELYGNMSLYNQDIFNEAVTMLCGTDLVNCGQFYLTNYTTSNNRCYYETVERKLTLDDWIRSIIDPLSFGHPRLYASLRSENKNYSGEDLNLSLKLSLGADYSDMLSPPPGYSAEKDQVQPIIDKGNISDRKTITSIFGAIDHLGAYKTVKRGYVIAEMRYYGNLILYGNEMTNFINNHVIPLQQYLSGEADQYNEKYDNYSVEEAIDQEAMNALISKLFGLNFGTSNSNIKASNKRVII